MAGPPYVDAKAKLVDEIAAANRCRAVYAELADLNLLEAVRAQSARLGCAPEAEGAGA